MSGSAEIFAYCERGLDPSLWAEPANAWTNVAFVVAGGAALVLARRARHMAPGADLVSMLLAVNVVIIGIGSFLFHTLATRWSALADVVPIGVFMLTYFAFALSRYLGLGWLLATAATVGFGGVITLSQLVRCGGGACLNDSVGYLPALAAMLLVGAILLARRTGVARYVFAAAMVFAGSLTLRTLDRVACDSFQPFGAPLGTHFAWHLLNALTLFLLLFAALRHRSIGASGGHRTTGEAA